jgi:hypothetical protein
MRSGSKTALIGLAACMALVVFVAAKRATESAPRTPQPALVASAPAHRQPTLVAVTSAARPLVNEPPSNVAGPAAPSPEAFFKKLEWLQATDKPGALSFARQGESWYPPTGELAEARKAMIVTLLVDTGDMSEARKLARRFIDAFPSSEYRPLVQGVTGVHPRPSGPR